MTNTDSADNRIIFWAPMAYNFTIRLRRSPGRIASWLFINLLPTLFYALYGVGKGSANPFSAVTATHILILLLFLLGTFYMYEWGYIYNDTRATRRESSPTLRLTPQQSQYAERHRHGILALRLIIFLGTLALIYALEAGTLPALLAALLSPVLFYAYNRWRSHTNVWLYFWLVTSRFAPFALLFAFQQSQPVQPLMQSLMPLLLIILIYPLEIGIERFSMPAYRYPLMARILPDEASKPAFRARYYLLVTSLLTILVVIHHQPLQALLPFYLFAAYRLALLKKRP